MIIANEVLDAMPFNRFRTTTELRQLEELMITLSEHHALTSCWVPTDKQLPYNLPATLAPGHCFENTPGMAPWLHDLYQHADQVVCLLCDYGMEASNYYARAPDGYARAFYQHKVHDDLLSHPGLQDITTHINFTDVAQSAVDCGWSIAGYSNQANFLFDCGLADVSLPAYDCTDGMAARAQIKQLLLPQNMGEMFKLIALSKNFEHDLLGFAHEYSYRL